MHNDLTQALLHPDLLISFDLPHWEILIRKAKRAGLLARIQCLLAERNLIASVPKQPRMHLESARIVAENEQRIMRWEVNRLRRALEKVDTPIVFLKGAAYLMAGLANARGRLSSDVDILVSRAMLPQVENALIQHGWEHVKLEDYDQLYYRTWAHELPPLRHRDRNTFVDVHHTILPLTGRLHPDPTKLLNASVPLIDDKHRMLAPTDLLLHSAAHMFQDGDLRQALRELVDLDELMRQFSRQSNYWTRLHGRAVELELTRPLFYALRYSHKFLATPIPEAELKKCRQWGPIWPALNLMDKLVDSIIEPEIGPETNWGKLAKLLLFARSHWLRMPPWLLCRHFAHKIIKDWGSTNREVTPGPA